MGCAGILATEGTFENKGFRYIIVVQPRKALCLYKCRYVIG